MHDVRSKNITAINGKQRTDNLPYPTKAPSKIEIRISLHIAILKSLLQPFWISQKFKQQNQ